MKTIGLIGGMSWESTAHYYRHPQPRDRAPLRRPALGAGHRPLGGFRPDRGDAARRRLGGRGRHPRRHRATLEAQGAGIIGLATNTMHICAPQIIAALSVPFVHIAAPTADALLADGIGKVGLLGTRFTMEKRFYIDGLEAPGLEVLVPDVGITNLNGIIYEELCLGIVREPSRQIYVEAIARLKARGAEAVILGCTEIGMLIDDTVSPLPTYDTTDLHAKALVAAALA